MRRREVRAELRRQVRAKLRPPVQLRPVPVRQEPVRQERRRVREPRRRLAVPLGPNLMHDLETRDGVTLKLIEPRLGVPADATGEAWCGLRPGARPGLFELEKSE